MDGMRSSCFHLVRRLHNADPVIHEQLVSKMQNRNQSKQEGGVLIAAPSFRDYGRMIGRAFDLEGWRADVYDYSDPAMSFLQAVKWTYSQEYRLMREADSRSLYNRNIQKLAQKVNPDLCLIINGNQIDKQSIDQIKHNGARLILWCYDSVTHYPRILENASCYDRVFVFEPSDVPILSRLGVESSVLPMAYDPTLYFPISDRHEEYDLSFVGTIFSYPERLRLLKSIQSRNPRIKMRIFTDTPPAYSPKRGYSLLRPFSPFLKTVEMRSISHSRINEIYNSSKICLNFHHEQSIEGLNPRVFEILGSGALQLVDCRRQLSDLFELGKEIVCYESEDDLQRQISYFLENPNERNEIARRGEMIARSMHTYEQRLKNLLRVLNL